MRQYRGKRKDNSEWVYGHYIKRKGQHFIFPFKPNKSFLNRFVLVHPETVGQSAGKKDRTGRDIFAGDICKWKNRIGKKEYQGSIWLIVWDEVYAKFTAKYKGGGKSSDSIFPLFTNTDLEIIGNIHDNPNLLEQNNGQTESD